MRKLYPVHDEQDRKSLQQALLLGSVLEVTLFLLFCHFLMVKIKSEKAVLWGSRDQRVLDQINWDQNFWALFDDN